MNKRKIALIAAAASAPALLSTVLITSAQAHGSMESPVSRVYACFLEGPESPDTAACKAAVTTGGTQPLYDWNEINIGDAAGRHRTIIPDGTLCGAGRAKYRGFDAARTDWPSTALPANGGAYTFRYKATAPHPGTFEVYVTKNGYNPAQPLKWSDLETTPFLKVTNPGLVNGAYVMQGRLPSGKSGRHLIYSIWQRSDSPEAFYTCSDVTFGGTVSPSPTPTVTPTPTPPVTPKPTPTPTPTPTPPGSAQAWRTGVSYATGALVTYSGATYRCLQSHTSLTGWEPSNVPALWQRL
ncbi:lytic polysaccharide monooxygenase auxiliary activity family 9 protein [Streptosporangium subroseum]|uniref:lytic polysaccharide monooxygenase auxiliary activity family 9 protein n=1 Tax=Streptosporangium subroseum TaxID=106412 RepID=UPI00352BF712